MIYNSFFWPLAALMLAFNLLFIIFKEVFNRFVALVNFGLGLAYPTILVFME